MEQKREREINDRLEQEMPHVHVEYRGFDFIERKVYEKRIVGLFENLSDDDYEWLAGW